MGKLSTFFRIVKTIIRNPNCLGQILEEKETWIRKGFEQGLPTVDILDLFPNLRITVDPFSFLYGVSLPIDLALLKALASGIENCRYLEIGTWRGESAVNVAEVASECVTVDLPVDEMQKLGISNNYINAREFFSHGHPKIRHIHQNSRTLDVSTIGRFDLIFIDGDHSYEGVRSDTQLAFQLIRDQKSIIVWHDYGYSPEVIRHSVLAAIVDGSPKSRISQIFHVSNTMCAVYLPGEYKTSFPPFPQIPDKRFKISIEAIRI